MALTNSANEYLPSRETGNTRQELDWLKKIIGDDNIDFDEKFKDKGLDGGAFDKIEALDVIADNLFDEYMTARKDIIKGILDGQSSIVEKRETIKTLFTGFLKEIENGDIKKYKDNEKLSKTIRSFNTIFETLKKELYTESQITIELSQLELNHLKEEVLGSVSHSTNINNINSSVGGYGRHHGNVANIGKEKDETTIPNEERRNSRERRSIRDRRNERRNERGQETTPAQEKTVEKLSYPIGDNYYDDYDASPHFGYVDQNKKIRGSNHKIENIFDDRGIKRVLENIFDPNEQQQLRRNTFGVNLDADHGLAYVVGEMENIINKEISTIIPVDPDERERFMTILPTLTPVQILKEIETQKTRSGGIFAGGGLTGSELKTYFGDNEIDYKKERGINGIDNEHNKIAKILNRAKWADLLDFAEIMKVRKNPARVLKEWFNAIETSKILNEDNILQSLADINGDAIISAENSRKIKEQFKYGDLGNLSGEQIFFTMNQAIERQNAQKGDGEGEKTVIKNIARMIDIMAKEAEKDSDVMKGFDFGGTTDLFSPAYKNALKDISENPSKANLLKLMKAYPQSKVFFLAALEKVGGGSSLSQPDLYDIFIGQEGKRLQQIDTTSEIESIRRKIENALLEPKYKEAIEKHGIIEVRESLLQEIIGFVDDMEISLDLDPEINQGMNMSGVSKTFYEKEARKKILGEIDIQNVFVGSNGREIVVSYKIGKSYNSTDGRKKGHRSIGPSVYFSIDGRFVGVDLSGNYSRAEQINYNKVISASLSDVQNAKYIGNEGTGGGKATLRQGKGLHAALGGFYDKDPIMGITQLEKVYQNISNRIFDVSKLTSFNSESIKNYLISNINTLRKGEYKNFIENNTNKLTKDIDQTIAYLKGLDIIDEIVASKKTDLEKQQAISSLLRIIQQGNIDQRKGDIIMNLHNDLKFTKFSAGLSAGTWFFGTNKDSYAGNGTTGNGTETPDQNDPAITEEGSTSGTSGSGGEARLSLFGVYVGARLSTWKNTYLPNAKQLIFTEQEMNQGIVDNIELGKDLETYAKDLTGLFNKKGLSITVFKKDGKEYLDVRFAPTTKPAPSLDQLLNIHYNVNKSHEFAFVKEENRLLIGNVGPIMAYSTTLNGKVYRKLCLGAKQDNDKNLVRLKSDNKLSTTPSGIEFIENGFEFFGKEKLDATIDLLKKDTQVLNDANAISLYKSLFDANGKLVSAPNNVTYTSTLNVGQQFNTGKITLYKNTDGKYILDYQPTTDNKLHMEYKIIGTNRTDIPGLSNTNIDISQTFNVSIPKPENAPDIEKGSDAKKAAFNEFTSAAVGADLVKASESLIKIIDSNTDASIISKLNDKNTPDEEKQYIVDSYLSVFAYESIYPRQTINDVFSKRGNTFLSYKGLNNKETFKTLGNEALAIRNKFIDNNKKINYKEFERETPKNIFGYTAFYRAQLNDKNKGYAATAFGKTNIIKNSITSFENQADGKKRIVENLSKDKNHAKLLVKQIQKAISNPDIAKYINENNVGELITKGKLDINNIKSNNMLDISSKKIILDSKAIFYLLGECLNESIGIRIDEVRVQDNLDTYKAEQDPDKKYSSPFYTRSNSISGKPDPEMMSVGVKSYKNIKNNSLSKEENNSDGGAGDDDQTGDPDTTEITDE